MRQNPIQQKREAMNVKFRAARLMCSDTPSDAVVVSPFPPTPPSVSPTLSAAQPVDEVTAAPLPSTVPEKPADFSEKPEKSEVSANHNISEIIGGKSDPYLLSTIFVSLLSGSRKSEIIPLLRDGLAKAKERNDDLYIAIFEGGIAANQPLPDLKRSIAAYHRAFDLCERRPDAPNGFLHSMIWNLFTTLDDGDEAAELMERARRNLQQVRSSTEKNNDLLREAWTEFEKLPKFTKQVENYRTAQDKESAPVVNKLLRESRLDKSKTLLLFPRSWRSRRANDVRSFSSIVSHTCGNYFFWHNGFGTAIDPDLSFVDNFYRIGGVLRDVHNIVLTASPSNGGSPLAQFRTLLGLLHQANVMQTVRFFVRPDVAAENDAEFRRFEQVGAAESIQSLDNGHKAELLGGGALTFRNGSCLLTLPERKTVQFLDRKKDDLESKSDELGEHHDLMVLPVETVEELVWSARQVRKHQPKLAVFDLPKENNHLILLDASVREFVGADTPIAYADSALALDVFGETFVDSVKAFVVSERDCWSPNSRLTFEPDERRLPEGLLFFEEGTESRFADEHSEILEAFLYNRRCRRGLYFS